ncbi:unnamed protein product [Calypogeia fissa]
MMEEEGGGGTYFYCGHLMMAGQAATDTKEGVATIEDFGWTPELDRRMMVGPLPGGRPTSEAAPTSGLQA